MKLSTYMDRKVFILMRDLNSGPLNSPAHLITLSSIYQLLFCFNLIFIIIFYILYLYIYTRQWRRAKRTQNC